MSILLFAMVLSLPVIFIKMAWNLPADTSSSEGLAFRTRSMIFQKSGFLHSPGVPALDIYKGKINDHSLLKDLYA